MGSHSAFVNLKEQLRIRILQIKEEGDIVWDKILADQMLCTNIITEQVVTNGKFTDYHELWVEGNSSQNILTSYRFNEIDQEAKFLSETLSYYESRAQAAIHAIQDLIHTYEASIQRFYQLKNTIRSSTQMSEIESIDLETFQWVDPSLFPKVVELNQEWIGTNMYQRISVCVEEMDQLVSSFEYGNHNPSPQHLSEGSSSGSPSSTECG